MSAPSPTASPRLTARTAVLGAACAATLVCGNVLLASIFDGSLPLVGTAGGEVWGHAWVQWWHADALPAWPGGPGDWVTGARDWPVIDPLPTALGALLGAILGTIAGYDLVVVLAVAGAFIGGAVLARDEGGDPWVGGTALALAPAWLGSVASGLTEDLAVGVAAVALGWVGSTRPRRALAAGACLGLLTACGLVLAWATGLTAVALGIGMWVRSDHRRRTAVGLASGAVVAVGLAVPTVALHADRLTGTGHRLGRFVPRPEPLWRLNPWKGVDLASFWVPGPVDPGDALVRMHPGYLGLSLVALGLVGGRSRWWWVLAAAMAVAPGPHLSLLGTPTGWSNPAVELLGLLPFGGLLNHHGRLLIIGSIALAVLAARGARRIGTRFGRRGLLLVWVGVVVDLALASPVGAPLPVADASPLGVYLEPAFSALPAGPVLQLPAAGPGVHFQRPLLDQRTHRRPLLLDPNRPGLPPALARSATGRFLASLAAPSPAPAPESFEWPAGVAVLVVESRFVDRVQATLGAPAVRAPDSAAWAAPASGLP